MASLYGYEIESELPLARLNEAPGERGRLQVAKAGEPLAAPSGLEPSGVLEAESGLRWYESYEFDGRCLLKMPPTGSFLLEPEELRVTVEAGDGDAELLEHRVASSAICTMLAMRGDLALHASGVEVDGGAVLLCGPSLRGKSTLARVLGKAGHRLPGEDGIAIDLGAAPVAWPGARGVRMRPAGEVRARSAELAPDPGPGEPPPSPVRALVVLAERGKSLRVERLEPLRALTLFTPNLIHSGGYGAIGAGFERLARLLHYAPAFEAALPDDLDALPGSAEELLDALDTTG